MSRRRVPAPWRMVPLLVVLVPCALAASARAGVTTALWTASTTVTPGAEFDVELRITTAGSQINAFDVQVAYDPAALTFMAASPTTLQEGALFTSSCGNLFHRFAYAAGVDTVNNSMLCNSTYVTGPGQLYKLHFKASTTVQATTISVVPGSLKFYRAGLYVLPVQSSDLTIGIGATLAVDGASAAEGPPLTASPNPGRGSVAFASGLRGAGAESLTVCDAQGRRVRALALVGHRAAWDGRSEDGTMAPDGIYFATLHGGGRAATIRFTWLH